MTYHLNKPNIGWSILPYDQKTKQKSQGTVP